MHQLKLALALLLAGCVQTTTTKVPAFRPANAPIYSAAAFDATRLAGDWQEVAAFTSGTVSDCSGGAVAFVPGAAGMALRADLCLNGQRVTTSGPVAIAGPGRLAVPGMADWWVLWVDSGYRTLAIGTPDGRYGFVLDRGRIGADRLAAAAEVFDFNGYRKGLLQPF